MTLLNGSGPATSNPAVTPAVHVPFVASLIALGSGVVWSFGAVTARLADESDAFQYLIWRSVAIVVVIESIARLRRGLRLWRDEALADKKEDEQRGGAETATRHGKGGARADRVGQETAKERAERRPGKDRGLDHA